MSGRVLRRPRFRDDSGGAAGADVEETEESIRQRLYGERRMVQLLAPEHSVGPAPSARTAPGGKRATGAAGPAVVPVPVARAETSGLPVGADG